MHKRIITILLLLPLVILIGLPCSMKQDFKHLLGIPVNGSIQVEKNNTSVCVYTYTQSKKEAKKKQQPQIKKLLNRPFLKVLPAADIISFQPIEAGFDTSTSIPIFLIYRKLII